VRASATLKLNPQPRLSRKTGCRLHENLSAATGWTVNAEIRAISAIAPGTLRRDSQDADPIRVGEA